MADREMTADRFAAHRTPSQTHPVTKRLLRLDAFAAGSLFAATSVLAVAGYEQVAYITLLGGAGCASLAATMMFRLMLLRAVGS